MWEDKLQWKIVAQYSPSVSVCPSIAVEFASVDSTKNRLEILGGEESSCVCTEHTQLFSYCYFPNNTV